MQGYASGVDDVSDYSSRAAKCSAAARRRAARSVLSIGFSVRRRRSWEASRGRFHLRRGGAYVPIWSTRPPEVLEENPPDCTSPAPAGSGRVRAQVQPSSRIASCYRFTMVATALAVKKCYGDHVCCVFIGLAWPRRRRSATPSCGSIDESSPSRVGEDPRRRGVDVTAAAAGDFDPPHAGTAASTHARRLFESAGIGEDWPIELIVLSGKDETVETSPAPSGPQRTMTTTCCCGGPDVPAATRAGVSSRSPRGPRREVARFAARGSGAAARDAAPTRRERHLDLSARSPPTIGAPGAHEEEIRDILTIPIVLPRRRAQLWGLRLSTCRAKARRVRGMRRGDVPAFIIDQAERSAMS